MDKSNLVFISHSLRDQEWVGEFAEELATKGIKVWLAEREIALGEPIAGKLEEGLRTSDVLVVVLSPENINSPCLFFDLGAALAGGKRIIAVVDQNVPAKDLPGPIRIRRYLPKEEARETARDVATALLAA